LLKQLRNRTSTNSYVVIRIGFNASLANSTYKNETQRLNDNSENCNKVKDNVTQHAPQSA